MSYKHYLRDIVPRGGRYVCRADESSGYDPDGRAFVMSDRRRVGNSFIPRSADDPWRS